MKEEQIKEALVMRLKSIAPDSEPENLKPEDNIQQTLGMDSFDYLQFIVALDEQFGITTPEEDYGKILTLNNLTTYITEHLKQ